VAISLSQIGKDLTVSLGNGSANNVVIQDVSVGGKTTITGGNGSDEVFVDSSHFLLGVTMSTGRGSDAVAIDGGGAALAVSQRLAEPLAENSVFEKTLSINVGTQRQGSSDEGLVSDSITFGNSNGETPTTIKGRTTLTYKNTIEEGERAPLDEVEEGETDFAGGITRGVTTVRPFPEPPEGENFDSRGFYATIAAARFARRQ
jgi:hypothetical protein